MQTKQNLFLHETKSNTIDLYNIHINHAFLRIFISPTSVRPDLRNNRESFRDRHVPTVTIQQICRNAKFLSSYCS